MSPILHLTFTFKAPKKTEYFFRSYKSEWMPTVGYKWFNKVKTALINYIMIIIVILVTVKLLILLALTLNRIILNRAKRTTFLHIATRTVQT